MKRFLALTVALVFLLSLVSTPALAKTGTTWTVPGDFATIQAAIDSPDVAAGDTILVGPGSHAGALVNKRVNIKGIDGAVIDSGPAHGSGMIMGFRLLADSGGTTVSHLTFEVALAIMNGAAVNDVVVEQNTFIGAVQAVSNWRGSGWTISHNNIIDLKTRNGGGIGILVGDFAGGEVESNVISHNKISGTLNVGGALLPGGIEHGGYNGSSIVLYADFRWGSAGTIAIKNTRVTHNKVDMVSNNPALVDIAAFEMTDTRDDSSLAVIFDNAVGFNDFRGTALQIVLTPDNLDAVNSISRNFGDNRGHGLHPSVFKD